MKRGWVKVVEPDRMWDPQSVLKRQTKIAGHLLPGKCCLRGILVGRVLSTQQEPLNGKATGFQASPIAWSPILRAVAQPLLNHRTEKSRATAC